MLEADAEVDRREFTVAVSFGVMAGERLALFGPSGSGKTTTLEVIAGLITPRRARIVLGGRVLTDTGRPRVAVPPWQRRTGLLRQNPGLFPHLSVRQNLEYGAGREAAPAATERLAARLGLTEVLADRPARLSGGQAHRVAIGRLLLAPCDALLLDEPYTGLDTGLRRMLTDLVRSLAADRGVPAVLVAHELAEAQAFADRLAVLDRGRILQQGPPDQVVRRPATRRVAELVGYRGFLALAGTGDRVAGVHPDRVIGGAHPDRGEVVSGRVLACRPAGAGWEADLAVERAGNGRAAEPAGAGTGVIPVRLDEQPPAGPGAGELTVTLLDPPWFTAGGDLLPTAAEARR